MNAHDLQLEWDEEGLVLTIIDLGLHTHRFNITDYAESLLAQAQLLIEPWLQERAEAEAEYRGHLRAGLELRNGRWIDPLTDNEASAEQATWD